MAGGGGGVRAACRWCQTRLLVFLLFFLRTTISCCCCCLLLLLRYYGPIVLLRQQVDERGGTTIASSSSCCCRLPLPPALPAALLRCRHCRAVQDPVERTAGPSALGRPSSLSSLLLRVLPRLGAHSSLRRALHELARAWSSNGGGVGKLRHSLSASVHRSRRRRRANDVNPHRWPSSWRSRRRASPPPPRT